MIRRRNPQVARPAISSPSDPNAPSSLDKPSRTDLNRSSLRFLRKGDPSSINASYSEAAQIPL